MTMENFEAKLRNIHEAKFPIVKAAFKGNDNQIYIGAMLIDTGSDNCILNKSILPYLCDDAKITGKTKMIHAVQNKGVECQAYSFSFRMGNGMFNDTFYVNNEMDFDKLLGCAFIGIIGYKFLINHSLVLDYETETLHTSPGSIEGNNEDYSFLFPMSYGFKKYNIPVVGLVSGDKEYVLIADSGANTTVVTKHMITDAGIKPIWNEEKGCLTNFTSESVSAGFCNIDLPIISIGGTAESPKLYVRKDYVQVMDGYNHIMEDLKDPDGKKVLPISGMLSSAFMLENKWVLDFGIGAMYAKSQNTDA